MTSLLRSLFSYPLLARELTERAARRRTYAGRVAYGVVLYAMFLFALHRVIGNAAGDPSGLSVLGVGRNLFSDLVVLQCWGVFIFQPALMAGVITYEKERESLSLLLLTGMSPMQMLVEKLLSGLLPMATLLLLALPLGAITMAYGGVSTQLLAAGSCVVLSAWLQAGAFALLCSAWCRTTVGAMLCSYLVGAVVFLAPAVAYSLGVRYVLWGADVHGFEIPSWLWAHWPPEAFARVLAEQESAASALASNSTALWSDLFSTTWEHCSPLIGTAAVCWLLARLVLMRRAFAPARTRRVKKIAHTTVKWFRSFRPAHMDLPKDDPVAWRESGRGVLGRRGRFAYLTLILGALTLAMSFFLLGIYPRTEGPQRLHHFAVVLGGAALLVLVVRSVGAMLSERSNQTLDILLTTPLGAAEILREKVRALGRYWVLFALLFGIVFALQGWSEYQYLRTTMVWQSLGQYWLCGGLVLLIYPPLIIWVSLLFALRLRAQSKAIIASLSVFAVWFIAPLAMLHFTMPDWRDQPTGMWLSLLSPLGILDANEHDNLGRFFVEVLKSGRTIISIGRPLAPILYNFSVYALIAFGVRSLCIRKAEQWLRK